MAECVCDSLWVLLFSSLMLLFKSVINIIYFKYSVWSSKLYFQVLLYLVFVHIFPVWNLNLIYVAQMSIFSFSAEWQQNLDTSVCNFWESLGTQTFTMPLWLCLIASSLFLTIILALHWSQGIDLLLFWSWTMNRFSFKSLSSCSFWGSQTLTYRSEFPCSSGRKSHLLQTRKTVSDSTMLGIEYLFLHRYFRWPEKRLESIPKYESLTHFTKHQSCHT